jgi:hypothetical protein
MAIAECLRKFDVGKKEVEIIELRELGESGGNGFR